MSISIYYKFKTEQDLAASGFLEQIEKEWSDEFDGEPYESWCWYEPKKENGLFKYEGATSLPMDEETIMLAISAATSLLTQIRLQIGGSEWSVNLDDTDIEWDEANKSFTLG